MFGVQYELTVPYDCSFIKQSAINKLPTHSIPPLPTLRGMIYNSMARPSLLNQDYHTTRTMNKDVVEDEYEFRKDFEEKTQISIEVVESGIKKSDLRKRMKHTTKKGTISGSESTDINVSYTAQHETIVNPIYRITVLSEDKSIVNMIRECLQNPQRLLYLGGSDHLVVIDNITISEFEKQEVDKTVDNLVIPNSTGETVEMLPIEMESFEGRGKADRGDSKVVSFGDANTEIFYTSDSDEVSIAVPID